MKIYLASSWKNEETLMLIAEFLRLNGYEVELRDKFYDKENLTMEFLFIKDERDEESPDVLMASEFYGMRDMGYARWSEKFDAILLLEAEYYRNMIYEFLAKTEDTPFEEDEPEEDKELVYSLEKFNDVLSFLDKTKFEGV